MIRAGVRLHTVPSRLTLRGGALLIGLTLFLPGCPGTAGRREVKYEVKQWSAEEREERKRALGDRNYQRDQLLRHVTKIRNGR